MVDILTERLPELPPSGLRLLGLWTVRSGGDAAGTGWIAAGGGGTRWVVRPGRGA